jgi:hypothetical protein
MTNRKFYRTTIVLQVLSEEPIPNPNDLEAVLYEMTEGGWSGEVKNAKMEEMDGCTTAQALLDQGSAPEFFGLTEDGEEDTDWGGSDL